MRKKLLLYPSIIALLFFSSCKTYYPTHVEVEYERVSEAQVIQDAQVESIISPYRVLLEEEMNVVIGTLDHPLTKERPESDIGNWMVDMMQAEVNLIREQPVDFSVQNQGGIRVSSMGAGPITVGEVFEVMPFDNMVTVLTVKGADVKQFFDHIAKGRGWPVSSGVKFKIKDKKAIDITINGRPLDLVATYSFAVPDYVANGGSGSFFLKSHPRVELNLLIRDLMIRHIRRDTKEGRSQHPLKEGRIINLGNE